MGDFHYRPFAITLEQYRAMDAAGKITRPLTLGTMQRRYAVTEGMDVELPGHMTARTDNRAEVLRRSRAKAKTRKEAA